MNIQIPYHLFKKRIKIRYPLISILVIIFGLIIPYFIPIDPSYRPIKSFENNGEYGHSLVGNQLKARFDTTIEYLDFTRISGFDTIIIISPDRDFIDKEISFLRNWINDGNNLILIGITKPIIQLYNELFSISPSEKDTLIDFESQHENINYVDFRIEGNNNVYTSISPTYSSGLPTGFNLQPVNEVDLKSCAESGSICIDNYQIGVISNSKNTAIVLDDWFLRNKFVEKFANNLLFLPSILNMLDKSNQKILIDESHYLHAPLNKRGVEAILYSFTRPEVYRGIIIFIAIIIPLIIGLLSGVISKEDPKKKFGISSRLMTRLDRLYIDKIVAAPLSLEERVLVNEKLEVLTRKHNYFQYVARLYSNYILEKNFHNYIPEHLQIALSDMEKEVISNNDAWQLIRVVNFEIEKAKLKQKEERDIKSYSTRIPGIKEV